MASVLGAFVRASLLAKAFSQMETMSDVPGYSRAGSLSQGLVVIRESASAKAFVGASLLAIAVCQAPVLSDYQSV